MAIDPRMAQNVAQGVYSNQGQTLTGAYPSSPYHTMPVDATYSGPSSKIFTRSGGANNPYHMEDVNRDFLLRLETYTNAMLVGDIKQISSEYLWAVGATISVLRRVNKPIDPQVVEHIWKHSTDQKGSLPEDFAKAIQEFLLGR